MFSFVRMGQFDMFFIKFYFLKHPEVTVVDTQVQKQFSAIQNSVANHKVIIVIIKSPAH